LVEDAAEKTRSRGKYRLTIHRPATLVEEEIGIWYCRHHHHVSCRVHILKPDELPRVDSVHCLQMNNCGHKDTERFCYSVDHAIDGRSFNAADSKLDLRIVLDLAVKLPNLEELAVQTGGYEWSYTSVETDPQKEYEHDWEGPRRDARHDFTEGLVLYKSQTPRSLVRASLTLWLHLSIHTIYTTTKRSRTWSALPSGILSARVFAYSRTVFANFSFELCWTTVSSGR
jgi:hypothetical protein